MRFVALLFALVAAAAQGAEPKSLESLVAPLLQAQTYCETGKFGASSGPNDPLPQNRYQLCAHRDGRFKYVENPGEPSQITTWFDGRRTVHRYVEYSRDYQQRDIEARGADHFYDKPREAAPAMHSRILRQVTRNGGGQDLLASLRDYKFNSELSDARQAVYERRNYDPRGATRIRVAADGELVRYEGLYDGVLRGYTEVTARRVGQPLSDADLTHDVPPTARYSPRNDQPVFFGGLLVLIALAGVAFWAWRFRAAEHWYDVVTLRRRLWKIFGWSFAAAAALLALLAVLTWGGSGHPPAIAYVMVLAVLAGIGFGLVACFLLASYAGQALAGRRSQETGSN